jgi:hypothetical protein
MLLYYLRQKTATITDSLSVCLNGSHNGRIHLIGYLCLYFDKKVATLSVTILDALLAQTQSGSRLTALWYVDHKAMPLQGAYFGCAAHNQIPYHNFVFSVKVKSFPAPTPIGL